MNAARKRREEIRKRASFKGKGLSAWLSMAFGDEPTPIPEGWATATIQMRDTGQTFDVLYRNALPGISGRRWVAQVRREGLRALSSERWERHVPPDMIGEIIIDA